MKWKEFVLDYLTFSKRDRIGIVILFIVILAVFLIPSVISKTSTKHTVNDTAWVASLKKLEIKEADNNYDDQNDEDNSNNYQYDRGTNTYSVKTKGDLFVFDPNTLSFEGWQKLGIRDKTIHTIQNYISKGGKFKNPEDLKKIYGLFPDEFDRLAPYIKIEAVQPGNNSYSNNTPAETLPVKTYTSRYSIIDINSADTTAYISLPGIGSKLAARIVNFRDKLGGFYSINQVGETYGLPDSTFQKIKHYLKLENSSIRKININTATVDELKAHPYIRYSIANPIIAYRNEHGPYAKVEDIKKVMAVTDEIYSKISPYLVIQ
jgi:competence ComEA-like helix-hairpin-helix protein